MNQHQQDDLNARLRARAMNLPRMVRCDHCSMPYYQTSAPHVCAGWATKENPTMNESEKFITTGVFSHERNTSGNCSVSGCPCRGWSAQESTKKENEMNNNTTGYPVMDQILKSVAPTPLSELCRYSDDGVTHCGLMRESHATLTNHLFVSVDEDEDEESPMTDADKIAVLVRATDEETLIGALHWIQKRRTEHEPVARGGEGECRCSIQDGRPHTHTGYCDDSGGNQKWQYIETAATAELRIGEITLRPHWTGLADGEEIRKLFKQIVTEHEQHHSLLAERERLRETATRALAAFRYMRDVDTQWWDFHVTPEICTAWDKLRAALNDQKGE